MKSPFTFSISKNDHIIENSHICNYGFFNNENKKDLNLKINECMHGFIEYWPSVILRKMFIVCIAKYLIVIKDILKAKYYNQWFIFKIFKIQSPQKTPYDIQKSMVVILRNIEECFLFAFVTPMIIPLAALINLWEIVCLFLFCFTCISIFFFLIFDVSKRAIQNKWHNICACVLFFC